MSGRSYLQYYLMYRKYGKQTDAILRAIGEATGFFTWPIEYTEAWRQRQIMLSKPELYNKIWRMQQQGLLQKVKHKDHFVLKLTEKGSIELLMSKARLEKPARWDRKWRMILFDIPEDFHKERDKLRRLLKEHGFHKLQASVFIHPFLLNHAAVDYLQETGLKKFIRIIRTDEIDNDEDLKQHFHLV